MSSSKNKTYEGSGVSYNKMDPFKKKAQEAASATSLSPELQKSITEVPGTRGESAFLVDMGDFYFCHVEEGLGTKNLVADAMYDLVGSPYDHAVAQCTVAMIVNDMITIGAMPVTIAMHLAVGDSNWFDNKDRETDLIQGWKKACDESGCLWAGGETPTLKGIVNPGTYVLSGSATGVIMDKSKLLTGDKIQHGDRIIIFKSSGVHANGITLTRVIADELPDGFVTQLDNGEVYGDRLLEPTTLYVELMRQLLLDNNIDVHYAVNVTGHGWRKFMRPEQPFQYVIHEIPEPQPVFGFIAEKGPVEQEEMYGNYNMGAGFAVYVPDEHAEAVIAHAEKLGIEAIDAGYIATSESKKVVIEPLDIVFEEESLDIR